jgi:hypothetical protein
MGYSSHRREIHITVLDFKKLVRSLCSDAGENRAPPALAAPQSTATHDPLLGFVEDEPIERGDIGFLIYLFQ